MDALLFLRQSFETTKQKKLGNKKKAKNGNETRSHPRHVTSRWNPLQIHGNARLLETR